MHDLSESQKPPKVTSLIPFVEPQIHTPYVRKNRIFSGLLILTHEWQSNALVLGQNHQERILRSHLEKLGTAVEFGSELKGFKQSEDHVTVQIIRRSNGEESMEETQVPWLIGTDGAHSIVRKTLGLSFLGETRLENGIAIGDIEVKAGLEHKAREILILKLSFF